MTTYAQQVHTLRREQCAIHLRALADYLACVLDPATHARAGIADDELAFLVLQHAGLLWRYTASHALLKQFNRISADVRQSLVESAAAYMCTFCLNERIQHIVTHDALSEDELDEVESVLIARDAAQATFDMARQLVAPQLASNTDLVYKLARAQMSISAADDALLQRPDIISVASRILEPLHSLIKIKLDHNTYWWFFHARQLDTQFHKELADRAALARALGLPLKVFLQPQPIPQLPTPVIRILKSPVPREVLSHLGAFTQLQAAKTLGTHTILRFINADLQSILKTLGTQSPHPSQKQKLTKPLPFAVRAQPLSARMTISPCPLPEQPKTTMAQWVIPATRKTPRHPCLVLVVNTQNGKIIGTARLNPTTHCITLQAGAWRDFAPCAHNPHALFLLALTAEPLD